MLPAPKFTSPQTVSIAGHALSRRGGGGRRKGGRGVDGAASRGRCPDGNDSDRQSAVQLRVLADFETIVNELLGERIAHNPFGSAPRSLGECFEEVVWTVLR